MALGLLLLLLLAGSTDAGDAEEIHLRQVNQALGHWLELSRVDAPYLLLDLDAGEARLQHHGALLRICPIDTVKGPAALTVPVVITAHLRRARPAGPYQRADAGPFDWERYLADAATDDGALLLSDGTLIYASSAWRPSGPQVRLRAADLRALFDALDDGTAVLWLPRGWQTGAAP